MKICEPITLALIHPVADTALVLLWLAWVLQAIGSAWKVRKFIGLLGEPDKHRAAAALPHAVVIVPFKGIDTDLPANLRGLCAQDYPDYELLLVVDAADDPAHAVLQRELARYPQRQARVLVAGAAERNEGQKVRNQLCALREVYDLANDDTALVFADSDAVPGPQWLRALVRPLAQTNRTAVSTGYRWLVPVPGASVWSQLASVINSSVACLMGKDKLNHAWGGSMAIRADLARRGDLRGRLIGALCDDYQFSRLARDLGLRVYFVPQCLVPSPADFTFAEFVNFAHRQYLLTRVYAPWLFVAALALTGLYVAGCVSALAALALAIATPASRPASDWAVPLAALALVFIADQARSSLRRRAVRLAFGAEVEARLTIALRWDRWATPLWMTLHFLLILRTTLGRTMNWRGIRYRLHAPQRCERID